MKKLNRKIKERLPLMVNLIIGSALIGMLVLAVATVVSHGVVGY